MQVLLDFAKNNPALVAMLWASVLWPVVSAFGNKLLDVLVPRAEAAFVVFEQAHPRIAAFAKVMRKLGVDPHALVARLRQILNGKPPPLPEGFGIATVSAGVVVHQRIVGADDPAKVEKAIRDLLAKQPPAP